jgi:hypothetical protein
VLVDGKKDPALHATSPKLFNTGLEASNPLLSTVGFHPLAKIHPRSGDFASPDYMPSEFDRAKIAAKFERLKLKVACISPKEFIVKSNPVPLKGTCTFSDLRLQRVPQSNDKDVWLGHIHADKDEPTPSSPSRARPFTAGGKIQLSSHLRGHADAVMNELGKLLQEDWPKSFHTCFIEDQSQAIVACFDEVQAAAEGDLSSYMQVLAKSSHPVMSDYKLVKDSSQWGVRDEDTASRFFAFLPPWAKKKKSKPPPAE